MKLLMVSNQLKTYVNRTDSVLSPKSLHFHVKEKHFHENALSISKEVYSDYIARLIKGHPYMCVLGS